MRVIASGSGSLVSAKNPEPHCCHPDDASQDVIERPAGYERAAELSPEREEHEDGENREERPEEDDLTGRKLSGGLYEGGHADKDCDGNDLQTYPGQRAGKIHLLRRRSFIFVVVHSNVRWVGSLCR